MKHVATVGLGYIGLPTALIAAKHGFKVSGFDTNLQKVNSINNGISNITETGINELLQETLVNKTFHAFKKLQPADCFIIAVPTPFTTAREADLTYVFQAGEQIANIIKPGNLIILESTVPVGTTQKLALLIEQKSHLKAKKDFFLAHCPERVIPGKIIEELITNDRIIGGICKQSTLLAKQFYKTFVIGSCYTTDDKTAEMVKLVENSSRDVQIAFANQISSMAHQASLNPFEIINLANKHPRVNILEPGCGVGGHCIAVDPWFLIESFPQSTKLLKTAREINNDKPKEIVNSVIKKTKIFYKNNNNIKPKVLILGLTYKANVNDLRESPALKIAQKLNKEKELFDLYICDPFLKQDAIKNMGFKNITLLESQLKKSDIIVILVKHDQFKKLINMTLVNKIIVDPCGLLQEKSIINETTFSKKRYRSTQRSSNPAT